MGRKRNSQRSRRLHTVLGERSGDQLRFIRAVSLVQYQGSLTGEKLCNLLRAEKET